MKSLLILLIYISYCLGTLVVEISSEERQAILNLDEQIEFSQSITFCIRFNFKGYMTSRYIFTSNNSELALRLRFAVGQGYVTLNEENLIFSIPKEEVQPHSWHHLCFSSNQ